LKQKILGHQRSKQCITRRGIKIAGADMPASASNEIRAFPKFTLASPAHVLTWMDRLRRHRDLLHRWDCQEWWTVWYMSNRCTTLVFGTTHGRPHTDPAELRLFSDLVGKWAMRPRRWLVRLLLNDWRKV